MDNNKTLSFLRESIIEWESIKYSLRNYSTKKEIIEGMIERAKSLIKEHRLLHHYIINIKTPATIDKGVLESLTKSIEHNLTGYGAEITQTNFLIPDNRVIAEAPKMCKGCKWLRNNECWHGENYYTNDFPIDCTASPENNK